MTDLPVDTDMDALPSTMFDRVIRALDVAYYEWTVGSQKIRVSSALADMFGVEPDTWTVERQTELMHPDDRPGFRAALAAGFKSGAERVEFTYRMRRAAGDYRWLVNRGVLERDDAGRVTRLTGAVSDITEAKQREAQNRNLNASQTAGIEHQSATIDVLKAMSSSPGNAQPVFELIVRRACEVCDAPTAAFYQFDGKLVHFQVQFSAESVMAHGALEAYRRQFPMPPTRGSFAMRAILDRKIVHIRDIAAESGVLGTVRDLGHKSNLSIPLLRNGEAIGSISLSGGKTGGFTDRQVELLRTFAEQAVIAIGSAETYLELQERTAALAERNIAFSEQVEHQSATIDVLKAMSASPGDAQPVFDLIVRRAAEVCNAPNAVLFRYDGELLHWQATSGAEAFASPEAFEALRRQFPRAPSQESSIGRSILSRRISHVRDIDADPDLYQQLRDIGMKSLVGVPLLRDGVPLGVIGLSAREPGGFSDSQVALLETFAEQAVIAIGSAETFQALQARTAALARRNSEYGEQIEHQAATIDVLKAMSGSPNATQSVFDLITRRARELCDGVAVGLFEFDSGQVHVRSSSIGTADSATAQAVYSMFPMPPSRAYVACRAILDKRIIHIRDTAADAELARVMRDGGPRSILAVPLMRDGVAIGSISLSAMDSGGLSDGQVSLLQTFAEQAVIAIGSAETYRELQERTAALAQRNSEYGERIEHQSATIDVLKVMSASPGDTQPVFDLIVRRAAELCNGSGAGLLEFDGELVHFRTAYGVDTAGVRAYAAIFPMIPTRQSIACRSIIEKQIIHIRDMDAEPGVLQVARNLGMKSNIAVPLLRDSSVVGALTLTANELGGFSDSQVELLQTFAEQAVIAIGSAETYRALQERTEALAARNSEYGERIEHQSATIDVLKVMSASQDDPQPVFNLIVRRAQELCNGMSVGLFEYDGALIHIGASFGGDSAAISRFEAMFPMAPTRESLAGRAILDSRIVHVRDVSAEPDVFQAVRDMGAKTTISLPLLRDGVPIGAISLNSPEPGGFSDSQIELLKTFAEQAVIAISSAETYRELQARTAALAQRNSEFGERIEQQSATIDVLKAMSASPDDTQPVFDLITRRAQELCNSLAAGIFEFDGELVHFSAMCGGAWQADFAKYLEAFPMVPNRGSIPCRAILDRQIVHVRDLDVEPILLPVVRGLDVKSVLAIPLLRDDVAIGAFTINSVERGGFTDSQVALLRTFAEQAVIAITSVANYRALRERTAELTRSVAELQALEEVLRAVNSSLDLDTVLSTIISRAVRLSLSDEGTIYEYDPIEEVFVPKSAFGMSQERVAVLRERRIRLGETHLGRSAVLRAPVAVDDVQRDPSVPQASTALPGIHAVLAVPLLREDAVIGGLVIRRRSEQGFPPTLVTLMQTFAGQAVLAIENARLFQEAREARTTAETTLADLRRAQDRLVQSEKMASLGQLTAGIAHEIKNPLNFVNNFSDLCVDLLGELRDAVAPDRLAMADGLRAEIDELSATLEGNLEKIAQHGRRADSIVKNMLLHSRSGPSEHRAIDLNTAVEEALNLAYHGARAETPGFNITMEKELDPETGVVDVYPQEFTRVMLNLIGNAFYAARRRAEQTPDKRFEPTLRLATHDLGEQVEIRVRDNGTGISDAVREKIFEPFFTTKPAGEGTGLGLSLSYDIVVKQHGGQLTVDSRPDVFTEFVVTLPRTMAASDGVRT